MGQLETFPPPPTTIQTTFSDAVFKAQRTVGCPVPVVNKQEWNISYLCLFFFLSKRLRSFLDVFQKATSPGPVEVTRRVLVSGGLGYSLLTFRFGPMDV